jgi:hypothetical protein
MQPPAFTRARIAAACREALERSGAAGVLPTPLEAVQEAAGLRSRLAIEDAPGGVLGALWFEERALFVDERQSPARRRFTEAHETAHLICPWHETVVRLDTAAELFGDLARGLEAEANFGAGQLIFQGETFAAEACEHERSLLTPFALAERYGASRHAAAHHYVESHGEALALLVAGRWADADGGLPVWRSIESESFRRRFGPLGTATLPARELPLEEARRSSGPVRAPFGDFTVEVANNRHCHLILVQPTASATRS